MLAKTFDRARLVFLGFIKEFVQSLIFKAFLTNSMLANSTKISI